MPEIFGPGEMNVQKMLWEPLENTITKGYDGLKGLMQEIKGELDLEASQVWLQVGMSMVPKGQQVDLFGWNSFHKIGKSEKWLKSWEVE